jgi:peptide/nickel transport system permease protein
MARTSLALPRLRGNAKVPAIATAAPRRHLPGYRTLWGDVLRAFLRHPSAMVGVVLIAVFLTASFVGLIYTPFDPYTNSLASRLEAPSANHFMGTDRFGRDILSRLLRAAYLALVIGVVSVAAGGILGSFLGLIAGFFRGWIGAVIMRVTDALMAFPIILLALAIMATLGTGTTNVMLAVAIATLPRFTRMMQAESMAVARREYVTAARAIGAPTWRILLVHVLPNALSSVLVMATLYISTAILTEATLSFLGLGAAPPTPTWGSMINDGSSVLQSAPWVALFPGLAITLTVVGFGLAGDGLRDALDARLRDA